MVQPTTRIRTLSGKPPAPLQDDGPASGLSVLEGATPPARDGATLFWASDRAPSAGGNRHVPIPAAALGAATDEACLRGCLCPLLWGFWPGTRRSKRWLH